MSDENYKAKYLALKKQLKIERKAYLQACDRASYLQWWTHALMEQNYKLLKHLDIPSTAKNYVDYTNEAQQSLREKTNKDKAQKYQKIDNLLKALSEYTYDRDVYNATSEDDRTELNDIWSSLLQLRDRLNKELVEEWEKLSSYSKMPGA